jgi:plasmid stabilization system protein ParE
VLSLTRRATTQVGALWRHYMERERPEAFRNLIAALREASAAIERDPAAGLPAPRSYPRLVRPGWAWVKAGRYWIAYRRQPQLVITAVFYETANIPRRL